VFDRNQINWNKEEELWISLSNQAPPKSYMLIYYFKHFNVGDGYIYSVISRAKILPRQSFQMTFVNQRSFWLKH